MSNDDSPEDGEVKSFRTRRRTRRGKRRSLRVPVDEVPRRSAADEVAAIADETAETEDAPMPLHARISSAPPPAALDDIEAEVTQPGSMPSPAVADLLDDDLSAAAAFAAESDTGEVEASGARALEQDEGAGGPRSATDAAADDDEPEDTQEEERAKEAESSNGAEQTPSERPSAISSRPPPASVPAASGSRPPPSLRSSSSSMPVARAGGEVSPSYVPPPPGVPKNLAVPEPAVPAEPAERVAPRPEPKRRDSVIVRGTVRVSDMPRPAGKELKKPPPEPAATSVADVQDAGPIAVEPAAADPNLADSLEPEEPEVELAGFEDDDEDELAGEKTLVRDRDEADAEERASTEIRVEEASAEDFQAYGIGADELDLEIEEDVPAEEEDDAEELELAEEEALEEIDAEDEANKPPSHPPPTPPDAAQVEAAQPSPKEAIPPPPDTKEAPVADAKPAAEAAPDVPKRRRRKPWWEDFFNDDYLRTVRPHPLKYVRRQCDFIEAQLGLERGATILDVGCGLGLHAVELASRGYLVVGLDLSLPMLSRAADEAQDRGLKINFLHGDMREMTFDGAFDAVLCWGTTFGYFDEETNRKVIERLYRALKPMGLLLVDAVNRDHVVRTQPNLVWFEGDGCVCMEETQFNYITSRLEVKRTVILDDGRQRENVYSIRLYALNEIGQLLHHQGFRVAQVSGQEAHAGVFFGADSPRMIIMAERRLGPGLRDTRDGASARSEKPPSSKKSEPAPAPDPSASAADDEPEEIDELDIEPE